MVDLKQKIKYWWILSLNVEVLKLDYVYVGLKLMLRNYITIGKIGSSVT